MRATLILILLFPLAGAMINVLAGRYISRRLSAAVACGAVLGALIMALFGAAAGTSHQPVDVYRWIAVGEFQASMSLLFDATAALMALVVTFVSFIIHVYSAAFMRDDEGYVRYFVYLNLFVFAMLVVALADNLVFVYLGWEGVGFCSYALIGFWYDDPRNVSAGRKAFLLTRIGDVAFGVALALCFLWYQSFSISNITTHTQDLTLGMATLLGLLFLWAALGKSAQLPLSVWLPDAMAGPTPVSALIHAATMVAAGAYLLIRMFPVLSLSPAVLLAAAVIGAVTALYSALAALAQTDIKRILAYSTVSQVAYMFLAVGAGDIVGGMFLLISHAFFKALLFLAAGCVIQALADEHDIFRMGNLKKTLPGVYWLFLIGALCLSAFPLIGGFFSKDRILLALFMRPEPIYKLLWLMGFIGALLTPLYAMRLFFIVFSDRPEGGRKSEVKPIPKLMVLVLWPLAVLALFDGLLNLPFGPGKRWLAHYMSSVPGAIVDLGASSAMSWALGLLDSILVLVVIAGSYFLFRTPQKTQRGSWVHRLLFSGFHLDRLYDRVLVVPYQAISKFLWVQVDAGGLDRGVEAGAGTIASFSAVLNLWNTGRLSTYLIMFFVGFVALLYFLVLVWLGL